MTRLLCIAFALLALTGCGPAKKDIAQSETNQLADKWDGTDKFAPEGNDPWGEAYTAKVVKGDAFNNLTVRSNGPDKLPQTRDDIVATRSVKHTPVSKVAGKAAENISEGAGKGATRGIIAGIREGIAGKKEEEKKAEAKKE